MLLYAWNLSDFLGHWKSEVEAAPDLDGLIARMLARFVRDRLRRGLGRAYQTQEEEIRGLRGRVLITDNVKRNVFMRGTASCRFQSYDLNEPRNQIIRSTLAMLAREGKFDGAPPKQAEGLRHILRRLVRDLDGIELITVTPALISRQRYGRNDREYLIMLHLCDLAWRGRMLTENMGSKASLLLSKEESALRSIFEKFVANFFALKLSCWNVYSQSPIHWNETVKSVYLPRMIPDLRLVHKSSARVVVLDTKFTSNILESNQYGKHIFDSGHLYQLYAYLRTQEDTSPHHRIADGVLLYPAARWSLCEMVEIQGHRMRIETVDLDQPWENVEQDLLSLVESQDTRPR